MTAPASIRLVSHACILIEVDGIRILTDPWFFGTAFNDGWELSPQPDLDELERLVADVDVIWISHEHPDHFHFPTLKWLASRVRPDIAIYFQKTNSAKVFDALGKVGFTNFVTMPHTKRMRLTDRLEIACYAHRHLDSAFAVFVDGNFWLLNVNDTELNDTDIRIVHRKWGTPNVVYNQFSIAGFDGVEENLAIDAANVLDRMVEHHVELGAQLTVPFASFVRFARSDNAHVNAHANTVSDAKDRFDREGLRLCVQSYGSDPLVWSDTGALPDNWEDVSAQSLAQLEGAPAEAPADDHAYAPVSRDDAKATIERRLAEWEQRTNPLVWKLLDPVAMRVTDWGDEVWVVDFQHGTFAHAPDRTRYDIAIASQPLEFAFKTPFGIQTLGVSGRYRLAEGATTVPRTWKVVRALSSLYNAEIYLSLRELLRPAPLKWVWERRAGLGAQIRQQMQRFAS